MYIYVRRLITILLRDNLRSPVDSILEAVLMVSPNKQYLGIFCPTTPAQHGPIIEGILSLLRIILYSVSQINSRQSILLVSK